MDQAYLKKAKHHHQLLLQEDERQEYINDSAGRRYLAGVYYYLAGAHKKAFNYYTWYDQKFFEKVHEPICSLFGALTAHKNKCEKIARLRLINTLFSNLYLLPSIINEPIERLPMWHGLSWGYPEYLSEHEFQIYGVMYDINDEERRWIKKEYKSFLFSRLRDEYLRLEYENYCLPLDDNSAEKRSQLRKKWELFKTRVLYDFGLTTKD
ncbi:MAG: hypothetical protein QM504_13600 [Pseudomonadota bacterium]